jgi:putative heme iron utilization protein
MQKQVNPINETNNDARVLARQLIRTARFGAIGVLQDDGSPLVSRVLVGTDATGNPVILISELSEHTKAIEKNNQVSLLLGEPKKGDPVAHPRISLQGNARLIPKESDQYSNIRARFIARHPKSELYIGFADFQIFQIDAKSANLNGGFGKAFHLKPNDFLSIETKLSMMESEIINIINNQHKDFLSNHAKNNESGWRLIGIDCDGFDVANGDIIDRREFKVPMSEAIGPADAIAFLTNSDNLK